jgi:hypothetical protein
MSFDVSKFNTIEIPTAYYISVNYEAQSRTEPESKFCDLGHLDTIDVDYTREMGDPTSLLESS